MNPNKGFGGNSGANWANAPQTNVVGRVGAAPVAAPQGGINQVRGPMQGNTHALPPNQNVPAARAAPQPSGPPQQGLNRPIEIRNVPYQQGQGRGAPMPAGPAPQQPYPQQQPPARVVAQNAPQTASIPTATRPTNAFRYPNQGNPAPATTVQQLPPGPVSRPPSAPNTAAQQNFNQVGQVKPQGQYQQAPRQPVARPVAPAGPPNSTGGPPRPVANAMTSIVPNQQHGAPNRPIPGGPGQQSPIRQDHTQHSLGTNYESMNDSAFADKFPTVDINDPSLYRKDSPVPPGPVAVTAPPAQAPVRVAPQPATHNVAQQQQQQQQHQPPTRVAPVPATGTNAAAPQAPWHNHAKMGAAAPQPHQPQQQQAMLTRAPQPQQPPQVVPTVGAQASRAPLAQPAASSHQQQPQLATYPKQPVQVRNQPPANALVAAPAASAAPPRAQLSATTTTAIANTTTKIGPVVAAPPAAQPQEAGLTGFALEYARLNLPQEVLSRLNYYKSIADQHEKEKRIISDELHRLKANQKSQKDWDNLRLENEQLKRQIQELKANAPFQQNDTSSERDLIARLQARVLELEAQVAGKVDTFQQLQLPSQSAPAVQQAHKPPISLPSLASPKKVSEGGIRARNGPVESPPVPGVNMDIPDAASSGAPAIDIDAEEETATRGRKRRASSIVPTGADPSAKRRRLTASDNLNEMEDRNLERNQLASKLQWHLGPSHKLLELADEAFLRLNRSFIAQQEQFSSIEPIQPPESLEGPNPIKIIRDDILAFSRKERSVLTLIPQIHKLLLTPKLQSTSDAAVGEAAPNYKRRGSSKEALRLAFGVTLARSNSTRRLMISSTGGGGQRRSAMITSTQITAAGHSGDDGIKIIPESGIPAADVAKDGAAPARLTTPIVDQADDQMLPPEAASLYEEENRFVILKHEAGLALLATLLSSSEECRRFMLGRISVTDNGDILDLGQHPNSPAMSDAPSAAPVSPTKNPRLIRKKKGGSNASTVDIPRSKTMPLKPPGGVSAEKDHPGLKLLEYLIELIPVCKRISTMCQRLLTSIRVLAAEATEAELQLLFKPLAMGAVAPAPGLPRPGKAIMECISCPSVTLEVSHLAIDVCIELARSRSVYDMILSSTTLWDRIAIFFGSKAREYALSRKKKEIEQHQLLSVSTPATLIELQHRSVEQIDAQLRLTRMACVRLFSLLLTIYPDSNDVFMFLVRKPVGPAASAASGERVGIEEKKVVSLLSSFMAVLSEETSHILSTALSSSISTSHSASSSSSSVLSPGTEGAFLIGEVANWTLYKSASISLVREMIQWLRLFAGAIGDNVFAAAIKTVKHIAWSIVMHMQQLLQHPAYQSDTVMAEHLAFLTKVLKQSEGIKG